MSIGIDEVRAFIRQLPDAAAVAQVQEAAARRLGELDKAAHDGIVAGRRARINDSLRPAFLRRLTGTVQERNRTGTRAGFLLDEESTRLLRTDPRNNRYRIPEDTKRYRLPSSGIPVPCLDLIED
ncbi:MULTISPECIES: hypothetical protein [Streptomyces]|uniref:HK97 gp10 family phage protein n=1 Tax=Streptomyces sp. R02 TaxID=3238623 RepID=A0AB39LG45_9ACTN|nr:hypothetical protein [Streptomyces viridodiastaticus]MCX4624918.1 hypothetical protein [Streptomyces viridodiastaticus]